MKLSEMILKGLEIWPNNKIFGTYLTSEGPCVLGSAAVGYSGCITDVPEYQSAVNAVHESLRGAQTACPVCGDESSLFKIIASHLNDGFHTRSYYGTAAFPLSSRQLRVGSWSREQIAAWLAEQGY